MDDLEAQFDALPENIQRLVREDYMQERRAEFDGLHYEVVEAFFENDDIRAKFEEYKEHVFEDFLRHDEEAWDEYLAAVMGGPLTGPVPVNTPKE